MLCDRELAVACCPPGSADTPEALLVVVQSGELEGKHSASTYLLMLLYRVAATSSSEKREAKGLCRSSRGPHWELNSLAELQRDERHLTKSRMVAVHLELSLNSYFEPLSCSASTSALR